MSAHVCDCPCVCVCQLKCVCVCVPQGVDPAVAARGPVIFDAAHGVGGPKLLELAPLIAPYVVVSVPASSLSYPPSPLFLLTFISGIILMIASYIAPASASLSLAPLFPACILRLRPHAYFHSLSTRFYFLSSFLSSSYSLAACSIYSPYALLCIISLPYLLLPVISPPISPMSPHHPAPSAEQRDGLGRVEL